MYSASTEITSRMSASASEDHHDEPREKPALPDANCAMETPI